MMPEFDNLEEKIQKQIEEILWSRAYGTKETIMGEVEDWIGENNDPDLSPKEWIERAKEF